jgi:hypothetical protein
MSFADTETNNLCFPDIIDHYVGVRINTLPSVHNKIICPFSEINRAPKLGIWVEPVSVNV